MKTPSTLLALSALLALPLAAQDPSPKEEVAKASTKTNALEKYAFKGLLEVENVPMIPGPMEVKGAFVKDNAFYVETEILGPVYRVGKKVVMKDPDTGDWMVAKPGRKVGEGNNQLLIVAARGWKAPHDALKKVEEKFAALKKGASVKVGDVDSAVYEGDLTTDGIKSLIPGGMGAFLKITETKGDAKVYVSPEGLILKWETGKCSVKGEMNGQEFEFEVKQVFELSEVGKAKLEIPADVKKALESDEDAEKPEEKKEEPKKE